MRNIGIKSIIKCVGYCNWGILAIALAVFLSLAMATLSTSADERVKTKIYGAYAAIGSTECIGSFKGRRPTVEELTNVLQNHAEWIPLIGSQNYTDLLNDPKRANLCGADLSGYAIENGDLNTANMQEVNLKDFETIPL